MTISLCMIVKNEERTLAGCLAPLAGIVDEMIVVDTGSSDRTKEIAGAFGARIFDYEWADDFAAARNFAFSKACGDYIYSADADEEIDAENREKFLKLKADLASGALCADLVQFFYKGQLAQTSVYNYDREYRPKLFRRVRPFVWEGAVHEQVRLSPVVYDSDIEILHRPHGQHAARDLRIFEGLIGRADALPARLLKLYARELFIAGEAEHFARAAAFFEERADVEEDGDAVEAALLVALRAARLRGDMAAFFRFALRLMDGGAKSSELCIELGEYWLAAGDAGEALVWFVSAREEASPSLDIRCGALFADGGAARCLRALGDEESAREYARRAEEGA